MKTALRPREVHVEVASGNFEGEAGEGQSHADGLSMNGADCTSGVHREHLRKEPDQRRDHLGSETLAPLLPWLLAVALPCISFGNNNPSKLLI